MRDVRRMIQQSQRPEPKGGRLKPPLPRWERIEVRVYTSRLLEQIPTTLLATPCEEIVPIGETYEICRSMVGVSSTSSSAIQRIHRW